MKKAFLCVLLALCLTGSALAGGLPDLGGGSALPTITTDLPDPGVSLGLAGSLYQDDYDYHGALYTLYLYQKPGDAGAFIAAYKTAATDAGYEVSEGAEDGNDALYMALGEERAILLYDYQGYMLLMVPKSFGFALDPAPAPTPMPAPHENVASYNASGRSYTASHPSVSLDTNYSGTQQYYFYLVFATGAIDRIAIWLPGDLIAGDSWHIVKADGKCGGLDNTARGNIEAKIGGYEIRNSLMAGSTYDGANAYDFFDIAITRLEETFDGLLIEGTFSYSFNKGQVIAEEGTFSLIVE